MDLEERSISVFVFRSDFFNTLTDDGSNRVEGLRQKSEDSRPCEENLPSPAEAKRLVVGNPTQVQREKFNSFRSGNNNKKVQIFPVVAPVSNSQRSKLVATAELSGHSRIINLLTT